MDFLVSTICIVVGIVVFVRYLESVSIYYPEKNVARDPSAAGLDYEDVYFKAQDGVTLNGWLVKAPRAKTTVIFLHGNAGNIGDRIPKLVLYNLLQVNIFLIDYRGYGKSQGKPTEKGLYLDALAAYDYIKSRADIGPMPIIVHGASLGGAPATYLANTREVAALILDSTFSNAADMAKRMYPFIPAFLVNTKFDNMARVRQVKAPKLFIHSPHDGTIPLGLGKKLFTAAAEPKIFLEIQGDHNDVHEDDAQFLEGLKKFLKDLRLV